MTVLRRIIRLLDRPGGRAVLALLATLHAKHNTGINFKVFYDRVWLHQLGDEYWSDSVEFEYYGDSAEKWVLEAERLRKATVDYWFHLYDPSQGDVIVDVGAGVGTNIPTFAGAVGLQGRVYAIEAHPGTHTLLERMVHWNRFSNVTCVHKAILGERGERFITSRADYAGNRIIFDSDNPKEPLLSVDGCALDDICDHYHIDRIALLKMNIEGSEREALKGMSKCLEKTRHVCVACHDFVADRGHSEIFRTKAFVSEYLRDKGFDLFMRNEDDRDFVRDHVYGQNRRLR